MELRDLGDDDLDAVFEMMRTPDAVDMAAFTAADPSDREAFDAWIARERAADGVQMYVVTENGGFAGTAALFTVDGDREVTFWIAHHAWGRGVASEALRLFARAAASNTASLAVLAKAGFTEVSRTMSFAPALGREVEEITLTLAPVLE